MARTVFCVKLQREAEGLDFPPYPGELGKRVEALHQDLRNARKDVQKALDTCTDHNILPTT